MRLPCWRQMDTSCLRRPARACQWMSPGRTSSVSMSRSPCWGSPPLLEKKYCDVRFPFTSSFIRKSSQWQSKVVVLYPCHSVSCVKAGGGGANRNSWEFLFLMNFELLTFPCRDMIKLSIHIWRVSKINPFLYRERNFWCDACIVYIGKLQMRFLHYACLS